MIISVMPNGIALFYSHWYKNARAVPNMYSFMIANSNGENNTISILDIISNHGLHTMLSAWAKIKFKVMVEQATSSLNLAT